MWHWIASNFRRNAGRTLLSAVIAGTAISLILVFEGFREGFLYQLRAFPEGLPADIVIVEENVHNFAAALSRLPQSARAQAESIEGIEVAHPLASIPIIFTTATRRSPIQLLVHEDLGGPTDLVAGRACREPGEMVLDARLAREHLLSVGSEVEIMDHSLRIVGLSSNTSSPFAPYAYITFDTLLDIYFESGMSVAPEQAILLSALLVQTEPGADIAAIKQQITEHVERAWAFEPRELGSEDAALGERLLGPALDLLIVIAWVIGLLIMSLMMYSSVTNRLREYGVQRAIGLSDRKLLAGLLCEALILVVMGLPFGLAFAHVIADIIGSATPLYLVLPWEPGVVFRASLASLGAAVLGTLVPFRRVAHLEPDVVFREAA